jgi:hypothetical protein
MYAEGIGMYIEVGIDVERAGDKVLSVSALNGEGGEVVTYLHS